MKKTTLERFYSKVDKDAGNGCWIWTASKTPTGYGQFSFNSKILRAHRFSAKYLGGLTIDGLLVCHQCDNPSCVNPAHLFLGTPADNSADMAMKDRSMRGSVNHRAVLTEAQVLAIRADDRVLKLIAADYGVSINTIYKIKRRQRWQHI